MWSKSDEYLDPYRRSHARHGVEFPVTMWASPRSQARRFEVFSRLCKIEGKRVLDIGCSRGDLADYLIRRGIGFASYTGVDALAEVIDFARSRGLERCSFQCGDVLREPGLLALGQPQVTCISGTLNTMKSDAQVYAVLTAAWAATGDALIFNFLSDRAAPSAAEQHGDVRRFDTTRLVDWALSRTSQMAFRQDYFRHGHDATILMRKSGGTRL
jgi:SAM-dependent methyltransferase